MASVHIFDFRKVTYYICSDFILKRRYVVMVNTSNKDLYDRADQIMREAAERERENQLKKLEDALAEAIANYDEAKEKLDKIDAGELYDTEKCTPEEKEAIEALVKKERAQAQKQIEAATDKVRETTAKLNDMKKENPSYDEISNDSQIPLVEIAKTLAAKAKELATAVREAFARQKELRDKMTQGVITRKEYLADRQRVRSAYKAHRLAFEQKSAVASVNLDQVKEGLKSAEKDLNKALNKAYKAQEKGLSAREKEYYKAQMKECFLHLVKRGRTKDGLISPQKFGMAPTGEHAAKINDAFQNVLEAKNRVAELKKELFEKEAEKFRADAKYEFMLKPEGMSEKNFDRATAGLRNAIKETASPELEYYLDAHEGPGFAFNLDQITQIDRALKSENITLDTARYIADRDFNAEKMSGLVALANRGVDVTQFDKEVIKSMSIEDFNKECEQALSEHLNSPEYLAQMAVNHDIPLGAEQEKVAVLKENFEQSYQDKDIEIDEVVKEMKEFIEKEHIELDKAGFKKTIDTDEGPEL